MTRKPVASTPSIRVVGTFDSAPQAAGLLPRLYATRHARSMTVMNGGSVGTGTQGRVRRIMVRGPVGGPLNLSPREPAHGLVDAEVGAVLVEAPGDPFGLVSERGSPR